MLQVARDLKLSVPDITVDSPATGDAAGQAATPTSITSPWREAQDSLRARGSALSEREREVAELLLLGMPYRDIGSQLFISAKTVEHHVARIRRRLGAESRPAMLSMLRNPRLRRLGERRPPTQLGASYVAKPRRRCQDET